MEKQKVDWAAIHKHYSLKKLLSDVDKVSRMKTRLVNGIDQVTLGTTSPSCIHEGF